MAEELKQLKDQPVEPSQPPHQAEPQLPQQQLPQLEVQSHEHPQLSSVQPDEQPHLPTVQPEQIHLTAVQPDEQPQLPEVQPHVQSQQPESQPQEQPQTQKQCTLEHLLYKQKLNEYTQKTALPAPVYHTSNEGLVHAPRFRSSVLVGGEVYTSLTGFPQRKAAEQDVARYALETINTKTINNGFAFIQQDTLFCKCMLNELANKMGLELPIYNTRQSERPPVFIASLDFDGATYAGEAGRSKREAEQLAARAALLSILVNPSSTDNLLEVIKSKERLFSAAYKINSARCATMIGPVAGSSVNDSRAPERKWTDIKDFRQASYMLVTAAANQPRHESVGLKLEEASGAVALPIASLPASQNQPCPTTLLSSKRKSKGKKRANKKMRSETQSPVSAPPANQVAPCTVAE